MSERRIKLTKKIPKHYETFSKDTTCCQPKSATTRDPSKIEVMNLAYATTG
jgi:hypothetical protein